jgi:amino acid adenylation domain-containing protein
MSEVVVPESVFGLAPLQAGMLFQALLEDGRGERAGSNIQQAVLEFPEDVPADALRRAWRLVAARHPVLRASFAWEGRPRPVMRIQDEVGEVRITEHAWTGIAEAERELRLAALLEADRRLGFDLHRAPLDRFHLCRLGPARVDLVWSYHHIQKDGRSFALLLDELVGVLRSLRDGVPVELGPPPRPFTEFAAWVSERDTTGSRAFFRQLLRGKSMPTPLPGVETVPLSARGTGMQTLFLERDTSARLRRLAEQSRTTLGTVIQAAWAVLLARWTGDEDVLFGNTRACRKSALDGNTGDMIGMFVNTLPVRVRCSDERTLREVLAELRTQALDMREHEHTPLVDMQQESEIRPGVPLFETVLKFEKREINGSLQALNTWWERCPVELHEQPAPPLLLTAFGGERLQLRLLYDRRRHRAATAERILAHLVALLERMPGQLDRPLGSLECLPAVERERQLFGWNATAHAFRDDLCIQQLFEEQADRRPDATALVFEGASLTFREVEQRANRLANALIARGLGPGKHVAFLLERSLDLVSTMIGIAKSGAAYVPIDSSYPPDRARFLVEDTQAALVITESEFVERLSGLPLLVLGADELARAASGRPARRASPDEVCYVIYTSGSTGLPKGVVLTHRAVVNTLDWVNRTLGVGPADRLLFVTSPGFDLSVYDVFGALGAGASVEIAATHTLRDPAALAAKLVQPGITIWDSAPAALSQLVPFLPERAPASTLRLALLSGDWIPVQLPGELRAVFPRVQPKGLGGATEASIWSNFHEIGEVDPAWRSIPYGKPIQNARYYILDRRLQPVPVGVAGDLYIGGACLARGYHGRAELTAERFLADPFLPGERVYKTGDLARFGDDGTIEFLGRVDFQVKVRGFRVELGEIEAALRKQPGVREAVCATRVDASGAKAIVAYAVPREGITLDPRALRKALARTLPAFMVPSATVILESLPVTAIGKLDREALPDPALAAARRGVVPARTPLETKLVALWQDVLQRKPIGIHDDFFELGGHSLLAVMIVTRAKRDLGLNLPLASLLETPTVAELAESLGDQLEEARPQATKPESALVELNSGGNRPPLFIVAGIGGQVFIFRELAKSLGPDQPVFAFTTDRAESSDLPRQSVEEIAAAYEREIERRGVLGEPLVLAGYSFGALVAYELAQRLRARGHLVGRIIAFDAFAPGYPEHMPLIPRALAHLKELRKRDMAGRWRYALERAENLRCRLLLSVGLGAWLAPPVAGADRTREDRLKQSWASALQAQSAYRPKTRDQGPLLLFVADKPVRWPATRMDDPAMGWGKWVRGRIDLVAVKGGHLEVFRSENVERMAREIRGAIDEVVRGGARSLDRERPATEA